MDSRIVRSKLTALATAKFRRLVSWLERSPKKAGMISLIILRQSFRVILGIPPPSYYLVKKIVRHLARIMPSQKILCGQQECDAEEEATNALATFWDTLCWQWLFPPSSEICTHWYSHVKCKDQGKVFCWTSQLGQPDCNCKDESHENSWLPGYHHPLFVRRRSHKHHTTLPLVRYYRQVLPQKTSTQSVTMALKKILSYWQAPATSIPSSNIAKTISLNLCRKLIPGSKTPTFWCLKEFSQSDL